MKKTNKRLLILLALVVTAVMLMLSACGSGTGNSDNSSQSNPDSSVGGSGSVDNSGGSTDTTPSTGSSDNSGASSDSSCTVPSTPDSGSTNNSTSSSKPSDSGDGTGTKPNKSEYTILIIDENTGKPIPNVSVFIQSEAELGSGTAAWGKTAENGSVVLKAYPEDAKYVYVENFPAGYVHDDFYELGTTGVEIKVKTEIVPNEDNDFSGLQLGLGDVMYDFELTAYVYNKDTGMIETKQVKLSDLLANGKKAVMLNFWYTTCTYCIEEFPYIQAAYEKYGDDIEIIGINAYGADNDKNIRDFMEEFAKPGYYTEDGCALTFPMVKDVSGIQEAFGFTVNPCSVMIDRYGVISMIQVGGVLGERYFFNAFEHYVSSNYEQELYSSIYDLSPMVKPDIEMSPENEIKDAVVNGDINITFRPETDGEDAEYAWPFIVYEKDGEKCLASTNVDLDNSYCILYVDVELKAGEAIVFDYYASTQRLYDVLYVLVDGKDIYTISGRPMEDDDGNLLQEPWQTCCPWVATQDGTYEVAFCYIKDESDMDGDDRVYLDNFKVVDAKELEIETYIPRYAATDKYDDIFFETYVDVVFNEEDGYYHVGTKDGPLLLASLLGSNTQLSLLFPEEERFTVTTVLVDQGEFIYNGKDVYNSFIMYCNYASNSKLYGYCPVTEELKGYLDEFAKQKAAFGYDENTWLQLCSYYEAYGTASQLEDPIRGLTTFSAFDAVETLEGEEGFKNTVTYTQIIMPRGFLYKFVPTKSGVYRITSNATQEVNGWVFIGSFEQWVNENGGDRVLYLDSFTGERYCPELLVDPDGNGVYERDLTNCTMIGYFEEGVEYYIDIAYYDVYAAGTFTFDLKYVGETFDVFEEASPGVFSYDEISQEIIATGIDVKLCEDEDDPRYGYYCHLLPNGELGSIVYADFHFTTNIFGKQSLETLIEEGAFDMRMTETDREAYVYFKNYYEEGGKAALRELWGDNFDANWELYKMEDIIKGIYHGNGPDYTEAMRKYLDKLDDGTDGTSTEVIYPERQGCVPVDKELGVMLQALMDKFTFEGVKDSWTKLCYYYRPLTAPKSVDEKLADLNALLDSADVASEDIAGEIDALVQELYEALDHWTIVAVERSLVDIVTAEVYRLIEVDKAQQ
ncbi:MAG: redoxin domain-containing protein [Clostridia bacterium]|nr:redoxin domain-containing protein [Clostridia bacterium]